MLLFIVYRNTKVNLFVVAFNNIDLTGVLTKLLQIQTATLFTNYLLLDQVFIADFEPR